MVILDERFHTWHTCQLLLNLSTLIHHPLSHLCDLFSWNGPEVSPPIISTRWTQMPLIAALANRCIDRGICREKYYAGNEDFVKSNIPALRISKRDVNSKYTLPEKSNGIYAERNENTCIWHFDLLEVAWHQQQTSIVNFNGNLMWCVMDPIFDLHCPQLKINNRLYRNVSFFNTLLKISMVWP